ncbi:hypothetical protein [Parasphingorhabdus sp.]|uniref:hypothetical protein n=1 Tax=Parasphingorhabdus sp. TaxID=2709688 RepID=UPI003A8F792C
MTEFFASGHAVDVVLAVLLAEALLLKFRGTSWPEIAGVLLPAVLMMMALRAALTGASWPMIAIPLALAFPVHIYDLRRRKLLRKD